jgi:hypothetical protein
MLIVGVAFLTLLERKVLGYIHIRKGPNRARFVSIFQPFSDAINTLRTGDANLRLLRYNCERWMTLKLPFNTRLFFTHLITQYMERT